MPKMPKSGELFEKYQMHKKMHGDKAVTENTFLTRYYNHWRSWEECINTPSQGWGGDRYLHRREQQCKPTTK